MKIGYINYLNCYPFFYHLFEKEPLPGIEVHPAYPSELNALMNRGELEMSPISAAAYADMQDRTLILPDFCLSSIGYVKSVILISRLPIEDLDGRSVGLSSASQTSVVLLKLLLKNHYGITPRYVPVSPAPGLREIDAALVIGNEAMIPQREPVPYVYDLGDLWLRKTGFPVVFAVFALQESRASEFAPQLRSVISSFKRSLRYLEEDRETLIRKAEEKYPYILFDLDEYYRLLKFEFSDDLKRALEYYFQQAGEAGLLAPVGEIRYFTGL